MLLIVVCSVSYMFIFGDAFNIKYAFGSIVWQSGKFEMIKNIFFKIIHFRYFINSIVYKRFEMFLITFVINF